MFKSRAHIECTPPPWHKIVRKLENLDFHLFIFWYPDGDPEHFQNLMGSMLEQDPSSNFFS